MSLKKKLDDATEALLLSRGPSGVRRSPEGDKYTTGQTFPKIDFPLDYHSATAMVVDSRKDKKRNENFDAFINRDPKEPPRPLNSFSKKQQTLIKEDIRLTKEILRKGGYPIND